MIKIEFSGNGDEVRNEMLKLLGLQELNTQTESILGEKKGKDESVQPKARHGRKPAPPNATWTEKEAKQLLRQIKLNAKKIIIELATKPEGYKRSELLQVLGLSEQAMRGHLSSVGFALRRMKNKPSPISKEKVDGELIYKLDPVVASVAK